MVFDREVKKQGECPEHSRRAIYEAWYMATPYEYQKDPGNRVFFVNYKYCRALP